MKSIMLGLVMLMVGCGNIEVPKTSFTTAQDDPAATTTDKVPDAPENSKNIVKSKEDKWRFDARDMTFEEAMGSVPDGWRIPTRSELADAFDNNEFTWGKDKQQLMVWSSTTYVYQKDVGWTMSVPIGKFFQENKINKASVVYIRDDKNSTATQSQSQTITQQQGNGVTIINNNNNNNNCTQE